MEILYHWKIIIELALLWYVIYMMLLFAKGTRSEQLLKGLLLIGIIYVLTQQLQLTAINWVLARMLPISVIALIIIFQPELRRALAQLGQFGLHQENIEVIDEISRAAIALSRKKTGALIVIEREAGLKSYMESGTLIDANITSHLLTSMFITQSILHDGAVIIERGRIAAAGCVLPLTQEDHLLPKSLGMRHRAAIGITEETDAVSVVVSEETGAISVASAGKLTHGLDEESLTKILKNIFYHPAKRIMPFHLRTKARGK
ncbi:MAG: diadenylate cyclase CdaA [Candidatus Omnitrophota bacterium]|jgi:diadenylate cyclase